MKKVFFIFICSFFFFFNLVAQKKWNIAFKLGPTITKYHWEHELNPGNELKMGLGLSTGFDFYRFYTNNFFFKTGANYNLKTYKGKSVWIEYNDTIKLEYKVKESYFTLPVMLGFYFKIKKQRFFVSAGYEFNFYFFKTLKSNRFPTVRRAVDNLLITPKYIVNISYLYKINEKYTLMFNPEYAWNLGVNNDLNISDDLSSLRLNFSVIYKF